MENLLIVGLGNPGPEYSGTRHNLGAECVALLAERLGMAMTRKRWKSLVGRTDLSPERRVWLTWFGCVLLAGWYPRSSRPIGYV